MIEQKKQQAHSWFYNLRQNICAEFERLEKALPQGSPYSDRAAGCFSYKVWNRSPENSSSNDTPPAETTHQAVALADFPYDGGEMALMRGRIFEKIGVNISTVQGVFSPEFRKEVPGASKTGIFWASGISVVAHPHSPFIPAIHMNTRFIVTEKSWFGGVIDLNPAFPNQEDRDFFHTRLKEICDQHDSSYYENFSQWCDRYFYIPHRKRARGVGGIFYDQLDHVKGWADDFAFTRDVGKSLIAIFPDIVKKYQNLSWNEEQRQALLQWRGLYTEFNLVYDRGTRFGLMTEGNPEAILMSLPPQANWP